MRQFISVAISVLLGAQLAAANPTVVPYLGYLTYQSGAAFDGTIEVQVQVFSANTGGDSLWGPHTFQNVSVDNGFFTVPLGGASSPDLAPALDSGQPLWLAFTVNGAPLSPRQEILAVPFARRAEVAFDADQLGGAPASDYVLASELSSVATSGSFTDLANVPGNLVVGAGTQGAVPLFTGASSVGNSALTQSNGRVGVGVPVPQASLHVSGGLTLGPDNGACVAARAGTLRWTGSAVEVCNGTAWAALAGTSPILATGGTVTDFVGNGTNGLNGVTYRVHTFTSSGTFSVTNTGTSGNVEVLVVGGGGGGGACYGAGGGAGGYVTSTLALSPNANYQINVGGGGASTTAGPGGNGAPSSIVLNSSTLVSANGGGGGGGGCGGNGQNGGSGGGASTTGTVGGLVGQGTSGQGNNGGLAWSAGGGGGGGAGAAATGRTPGAGLTTSIRGTAQSFGGGGGGGSCDAAIGVADMPGGLGGGGAGGKLNPGQGNATANTGGGGGGTCQTACSAGSCTSGTGGSGIVVIRYPL